MSTFTLEALKPTNVPLDGDITSPIQYSPTGGAEQHQISLDDIAVPSLARSSPSSIVGAVDGYLYLSTENSTSMMAESSPCVAAYNLLSAGLVTASTIPETTLALDAIIESDEGPMIPNSPADGSRPSTPSFVPPKYYCE